MGFSAADPAMHAAVGSTNPVKIAAVEQVLSDDRITAVAVESGVPEQPRGQEQTVTGAENRAAAAVKRTDADIGVGIEGGVVSRDTPEGLWLVMWAAVTDGSETAFGAGPSIRLPEPVATRVQNGEELGPVLDDVLEREHVSEQEGAIGVYTDGHVTRTEALMTAVAGALGPFRTQDA